MARIYDQRIFEGEDFSKRGKKVFGTGVRQVRPSDGTLEKSIACEEGVVVQGEITDASFGMEGGMKDLDMAVLEVKCFAILDVDGFEGTTDFFSCNSGGIEIGVGDKGSVFGVEIDRDGRSWESLEESVDTANMVKMAVGEKDGGAFFVMLSDIGKDVLVF